MSDEVKAKSAEGTSAPAASRVPFWKSVVVRRWLPILVVASLVVDGVVLLLVHKSTTKSGPQPEYTVGTFAFRTSIGTDAQPRSGTFVLHVRFIDDLDSQARQHMVFHQFRVQEAVEGLLRKAREIDLDDSAVARLKHQIEDRIDDCIDLRSVAEVIITNVNLESPLVGAPVAPVAAAAARDHKISQSSSSAAEPTAAGPANDEIGSARN
jgi:hypothetical protein